MYCFTSDGSCGHLENVTYRYLHTLNSAPPSVCSTDLELQPSITSYYLRPTTNLIRTVNLYATTASKRPVHRYLEKRNNTVQAKSIAIMPPAASDKEKQQAAQQAVDILHEISTILVRIQGMLSGGASEAQQQLRSAASTPKQSFAIRSCKEQKHKKEKEKQKTTKETNPLLNHLLELPS